MFQRCLGQTSVCEPPLSRGLRPVQGHEAFREGFQVEELVDCFEVGTNFCDEKNLEDL